MKREPLTQEDFAIVLDAIGRGAAHIVKAMTLDDKHEAQLFADLRHVTEYIKSVHCNFAYAHNSFAFWDKAIA